MRLCFRPSQSSSSHSSIDTAKSTFSEMTSEGHLRYLSALLVDPNSLVSSHRIQRLVQACGGRDVRISQIAYSMNRERIGALKICAGM